MRYDKGLAKYQGQCEGHMVIRLSKSVLTSSIFIVIFYDDWHIGR